MARLIEVRICRSNGSEIALKTFEHWEIYYVLFLYIDATIARR
jgi:hypothetical protein